MSDEIRVFRISAGRSAVDIDVMNVRFHFYRKADGKIGYSKSKPEAQVYDASQLWVPDVMFRAAYRQAAAILTPARSKEAPITRTPAPAQPPAITLTEKATSPSQMEQMDLF